MWRAAGSREKVQAGGQTAAMPGEGPPETTPIQCSQPMVKNAGQGLILK